MSSSEDEAVVKLYAAVGIGAGLIKVLSVARNVGMIRVSAPTQRNGITRWLGTHRP